MIIVFKPGNVKMLQGCCLQGQDPSNCQGQAVHKYGNPPSKPKIFDYYMMADFWVLIKYFRKLNFYVKNGSKKSIYELSYLILSNCCSKIMIMFSVILKNYMVEMRPFFKKKTIIIFKKPSLLFNIWNYQFIFIWQYCYVLSMSCSLPEVNLP